MTTKYRNKPTEIDGIKFASRKEARRYSELKLLERAGEIDYLTLQVSYDITVNRVKICRYVADFVYFDKKINRTVVEDTKGIRTPAYKLKKKLMLAVHNIDITET